jgi:flagellar export protein FliJ
MKRFEFRLDRVLDWKTVVAQQEQAALDSLRQEKQEITASLQCLNQRINDLSQSSHTAQNGQELAYAASARSALLRDRSRAEGLRAACDNRIAAQQDRYRTADTERRLVGKLKERSHIEWTAEASREMEATASDLYLGGWNRR